VKRATSLIAAALLAATGALQAQTGARGPTGQLLYPAKGQSTQQAERDRFECHEWAREQSGFDPTQMAQAMPVPPAAPPAQPAAAPQASRSSSTGGLVAGAAGGAAIAELADRDAGKGAAVGVLGARLRQQMQQREAGSQQQAQQQAQLQAAQQQALQQRTAQHQRRDTYDRGFAACMEARGYVVK